MDEDFKNNKNTTPKFRRRKKINKINKTIMASCIISFIFGIILGFFIVYIIVLYNLHKLKSKNEDN